MLTDNLIIRAAPAHKGPEAAAAGCSLMEQALLQAVLVRAVETVPDAEALASARGRAAGVGRTGLPASCTSSGAKEAHLCCTRTREAQSLSLAIILYTPSNALLFYGTDLQCFVSPFF